MSKIGKSLFGLFTGNNKSSCCGGSLMLSVKKVNVDGKDMDIAGMDEEFAKHLAAGATPDTVNGDELSISLLRMNKIQGIDSGLFKAAVLKE